MWAALLLQRRMAGGLGLRGKGGRFVGADGTAVPQLTVPALCRHGSSTPPLALAGLALHSVWGVQRSALID